VERRQGRGTFILDKKSDDNQRMLACLEKADSIIGLCQKQAKANAPPRVAAELRVRFAEELFTAGYAPDPEPEAS